MNDDELRELICERDDWKTISWLSMIAPLGTDVDTSGNPCVWLNYYRDEDGASWQDTWSCQCDDDGYSPYRSEWLGPEDQAEIALWESLPDAT